MALFADRRVVAVVLAWGKPGTVGSGPSEFREWFCRGCVDTHDVPLPIFVRHQVHGGREAGYLYDLRDEPWGLIGTGEVAHSLVGDGLLDLLDQYGQLPLSPAFVPVPGGTVVHDQGLSRALARHRVELSEAAVCHRSIFTPWTYLRRYGR